MAVSFILSIILVKYYDEKIYGDFVLSFSTIEILGVFSLIGFDQFFLVHIPKLKKDPETISFIYLRSRKSVLIVSILMSLLIFGFSYLDVPLFKHETTRYFFRYGALSLPVFAISTLATSLLNSLRKVVLSQLTDRVIRPLIVLCGTIVLIYLNLSALYIIYIYIGAVVLGYAIDVGYRKKHFTLYTT